MNAPSLPSSSPLRIAIAGASGRMGRMLIEAVRASDDCTLTGALDIPSSPALGTDATDGIAALRFEDGRLDLTLSGPAAARAEALVGLLASRGLLANLRQEGSATHLLLRQENLQ